MQVAYTPRKCAALKESGSLVVIERDQNADRAVAKEFKMTSVPGSIDPQVLVLLALLVQKYKY